MEKVFKYCENPDAEVPKMFIDKEVGGQEPNIQGGEFLKELLFLSDMEGKGTIDIMINSPGGIVTEGQAIYAACLMSKASVNTTCFGIAASIAGVIFQAGKKRIMYDYATLMYHPAYSEDGKVDKGLEALNNAICKMIASRTGKTEDEIWAIMNRGRADDKGTWIGAEEALAMGFCDEVIASDKKNKVGHNSVDSLWAYSNKIFNRVKETKNIKKMSIVNKALGLQDEASDESKVAAVAILNKSVESMQKKYDEMCQKADDLKKEIDEMKKDKAKADEEMKAKADEEAKAKAKADEDKAKADEDAKNAKADEDVKNAVAAGKIKNDAAMIKAYTDMYKANPEQTKALIDAIPATKTSPVFTTTPGAVDIKDSAIEAQLKTVGIKPGTAKWVNAIKAHEISTKK